MPLIPIIFFIIFVTILAIYFLYRFLTKKSQFPLIQDLTNLVDDNASYEFVKNSDVQDFKNNPIAAESIEYEGELLLKANVRSLYLLHGTFVGDDPWHILSLLENNFSNISPNILELIKANTKKTQDLIAKDLGNFTDEHVNILENATNGKIQINNFTWSSGNHHLARLKGCLNLIEHIANHHDNGRILFIGHSHAGQIFALLTNLLYNNELLKNIIELINESEIDLNVNELHDNIRTIKKYGFDFVTMGTPCRYQWLINSNTRVLHFINHRTEDVLGGNMKGFITTKDGDYIQQWGVQGSDMKSPNKKEQEFNLKLDRFFGIGTNLELFKQNVKLRKRLHNVGHHYLIDYGDKGVSPNFLKTVFGHGVYTKKEFLNYHLYLINKYLYPSESA